MIYRLEISRKAQRELRKLPHQERERIRSAIDSLATDPRPNGCRKIAGEDRAYRIRVGVYRVI